MNKHCKIVLFICCFAFGLLCFVSTAKSQICQEYFKTWGGSNADWPYSVETDSSGDFYLSGVTDSSVSGGEDFLLLKYNSLGTFQWAKSWVGTNLDEMEGSFVDSSGNVYMSGYVASASAGKDVIFLKFNSAGTLQWARAWSTSNDDDADDISLDSSGNIYITGGVNPIGPGIRDTLLIKYNSALTFQWAKTWGGTYDDSINGCAIHQSTGHVYLAGNTESFGSGGRDALVLKYDSSGGLVWARTWGGSNNDDAYVISVDNSENVYVAGGTSSFAGGGKDIFLLKCDSNGTLLWDVTWEGSNDDEPGHITIDASGNIYLPGSTSSFGVGGEALLLKYNSLGQLQWSKTWGGSQDDWFARVLVQGSTYHIAGYTESTNGILQDCPDYSQDRTGAWGGVSNVFPGSLNGTEYTPSGTVTTPDDSGGNGDVLFLKLSGCTIPTLSEWGMITFFILLVGSALWIISRRTGHKPA